METKIAKVISNVFHPLLMPTYSLIVLFYIKSYLYLVFPGNTRVAIIAIVFFNTALMPALIFFFMKLRNIISSLRMEDRRERVIPFIVTALFYFGTYVMLRKFHLPSIIYYLTFGSSCLIIIALTINFWWKISIHMLGIGGLTGSLLCIAAYLSVYPGVMVALTILIAGLIGFARLKLLAHTPMQVYAGFVTGAFFMMGLFWLIA